MSKPEVHQAFPGKKQLTRSMAIAGIACVAWYIGVRPIEQRLAAARAEVVATGAQLGEFEHGVNTGPNLDQALASLAGQARVINSWAAKSGDASKLYDLFRQLAADNSVRIERVEPSASRNMRSAPSAAAVAAKDPAALAEVFGYNIEVTGGYENVTRFIDSCERLLGATRVASFQLAPVVGTNPGAGEEPMLSAIVETAHLKISISDVGAPGAKPAGGGA
jgi:hypothetical protein